MKSHVDCENLFSNSLQNACSGFLRAACDSRQKKHLFVPICRKNRPLSSILFIISGNLSAVSLTPMNSLSAVSLTLANNLSVASLTLVKTFFNGVVDTGQK
jgi:hypothetical protein